MLYYSLVKCFDEGERFTAFTYEYRSVKKGSIGLVLPVNFKRKKRFSKRAKGLMVYREVSFEQWSFVLISVYEPYSGVQHYMMRIKDQRVTDFCKHAEII